MECLSLWANACLKLTLSHTVVSLWQPLPHCSPINARPDSTGLDRTRPAISHSGQSLHDMTWHHLLFSFRTTSNLSEMMAHWGHISGHICGHKNCRIGGHWGTLTLESRDGTSPHESRSGVCIDSTSEQPFGEIGTKLWISWWKLRFHRSLFK